MNAFEEGLKRYFDEEKLAKIRAKRIGIAGLGGLGSNAAAALVRCGFRKFVLCDFDTVERSNLNRQWYFLEQLGEPKTDALAANLTKINPDLELTRVRQKVTPENIDKIFANCDALIEAFDKAEDKRMLTQAMWETDKFFVSASGLAGWGDSDALTCRKLKKNIVLIGDHKSEVSKDLPPCAPRVLIAAAKQADALLAWALT